MFEFSILFRDLHCMLPARLVLAYMYLYVCTLCVCVHTLYVWTCKRMMVLAAAAGTGDWLVFNARQRVCCTHARERSDACTYVSHTSSSTGWRDGIGMQVGSYLKILIATKDAVPYKRFIIVPSVCAKDYLVSKLLFTSMMYSW